MQITTYYLLKDIYFFLTNNPNILIIQIYSNEDLNEYKFTFQTGNSLNPDFLCH